MHLLRACRVAGRALALFGLLGTTALVACGAPTLNSEGRVTFPQPGGGAAVMGPNGLEIRDRNEIPRPLIVRDVDQPFRAPIGFILPASGVFTKTSTPIVKTAEGVAVVVRSSDVRVPTWGGEILVRVDVHAVSNDGARPPIDAVIVLEGGGDDSAALVAGALDGLGAKDHVTIIDARGARVVVPTIPATHRSLALAAIAQRLSTLGLRKRVEITDSMRLAAKVFDVTSTPRSDRRLLILTASEGDGAMQMPSDAEEAVDAMERSGVKAGAIAASPSVTEGNLRDRVGPSATVSASHSLDDRIAALRTVLPLSGPILLRDVTVDMQGSPAPTHVLETSGPEPIWTLDGGAVPLGDLADGALSAEVFRVSVPPWVPGAPFDLSLILTAHDAVSGALRTLRAQVTMTYDDDITRIADSRAGDVIAYASALATMDRLQAAFLGEDVTRAGGMRQLAELQVESLGHLARDFPDRGFAEDALVLGAMLQATQ